MKKTFVVLAVLSFALTANALTPLSPTSPERAYRFYKNIDSLSIKVPTVVEAPFGSEFMERYGAMVYNTTTGSYEPSFFMQETLTNEAPISIRTEPSTENPSWMNDKNTETFVDFPLHSTAGGSVRINLTSAKPITSSALTALLANNVALPTSVDIRAAIDGESRIIVAAQRMDGETVRFPQTTSKEWFVTFTFSQPLRITELRLLQDNAVVRTARSVRFLAQPANAYRIYFDPDRSAYALVPEAGDLASAKDVLKLTAIASVANPEYQIADTDKDGVPDIHDNCVSISNTDQTDVNSNGRGDACDDFDQDGFINSKDNCPNNPNREQIDTDGDSAGDACDTEESRITEKYAWIPWVGIGFAALILITLLALTVRSTRVPEQDNQ